jgi:ABC-type transport system substrate-binding protein
MLTRWFTLCRKALFIILLLTENTFSLGNDMQNILRITTDRSPLLFNHIKYSTLTDFYIHFNITATLIELDKDNQIVSGLAKRWTVNNNGKQYTFFLDTTGKWSDGNLITPDNIIQSIFYKTPHRGTLPMIMRKIVQRRNINKIVYLQNENELVVNLPEANSKLLEHFSRPEFGVIHPLLLKKNRQVFSPSIPTSGAYAIESIDENKIVLIPNEHSRNVKNTNPQRIEFSYKPEYRDVLKLIREGVIDFTEVQDEDIFSSLPQNGYYNTFNGGLDNLATLQARHLNDKQIYALDVLKRYLNKQSLGKGPRAVAHKLVAHSIVQTSDQKIKRFTKDDARNLLKETGSVQLRMILDSKTTLQQMQDALSIQTQAREIGVEISIIENAENFVTRWENEKYELTMRRMGVFDYDEVDLLYGYFCTGYKPYKKLKPLVCDEINLALQTGNDRVKSASHLSKVYDNINNSSYIIPLYHYPRRFAVHKKWKLENYNYLLPYPIFKNFRLVEQ